MRRTLPISFLALSILSGCTAIQPAPSPVASPGLVSPSTAPSPSAVPAPTTTPSPDGTTLGGDGSPTPPPLEYDWRTFPRLPPPVLAAGGTEIEATAVAGCITRFYEPADDALGRVAQSDPECQTGPLTQTAPLVVAAGALLTVRAPDGFVMGAEIIDGSDVFATVSATRAFPARIDGLSSFTGVNLARESGFNLGEISFGAPTDPGDYLVIVAAQLSRIDRTYRELDTRFLYWLRVTAG